MNTLKREDLLETKWDVSEWTQEMKTRWQQRMFDLGIKWWAPFGGSTKTQELDKDYYFIDKKGCIFYGENRRTYDSSLELVTSYYKDVFPEESQTTSAPTGSGVHAESGSVNDTRKNTPDNETFTLDTLRKVCQEHGLYMTLDPYGEVIVTEVSSDVEYEVENEDQLRKLLSALEVLNSYVKH